LEEKYLLFLAGGVSLFPTSWGLDPISFW